MHRTLENRKLPLEEIASITCTLAVLLDGGITPASAWKHASHTTDNYPKQFTAACLAAGSGRDIAAGIRESDFSGLESPEKHAWFALAAAWWVGTRSGANMANSLLSLSRAFSHIASVQREAQVAMAGPSSTAKIVGFLPIFSLVLSAALGFGALNVLLFSIPGLLCLSGGLLLMFIYKRWTGSMITKSAPQDNSPGLDYELCIIAVSGGGAITLAWECVRDAMRHFNLPIVNAKRIDQIISLSFSSGAPAGKLLRAESELAQLQARTEAQKQIQRLAVKLMLPLGLCILPAFMLIGIVPLVISMISGGIL